MGQGQHRFRSFEQEDGLSGNSIRDLLEDRKGFIWIATDNGLDRFDGRNFLNLRFVQIIPVAFLVIEFGASAKIETVTFG